MKNLAINPAYLFALVCDQVKTIKASFNFEDPKKDRLYTYMTILDLKEGEDVIVETPDGLKVAMVVEVHEEAELEPRAPYQYKWAVSRSGSSARSEQEHLHSVQKQVMKQLAQAEKKANRKKVKEQLKEHFGDTITDINVNLLPESKDE